ncbi:non-ribosomal peptide synthetase [Photorhabdus khanii]|nr:non-ribosomal peptide synthetase [Photorhabdus khanii]
MCDKNRNIVLSEMSIGHCYPNLFLTENTHQFDEYCLELSPQFTTELRFQCDSLAVSFASLFHLAWGVVLAKYSGQEQVVIGIRQNTQIGADQHNQAGQSILSLHLSCHDQGVSDALRFVEQCLSSPSVNTENEYTVAAPLLAFSDYQCQSDNNPACWRNGLGKEVDHRLPLTLTTVDDGIHLTLTTCLMAAAVSAKRLSGYLQQTLAQLVWALHEQPNFAINQLDILPPEERTLLLDLWNDTQSDYPDDVCIHTLFEQQVATHPEATALVFYSETLSYAELNCRANQLAHFLIAQGVVPDSRVAICVERSPLAIISLLAILKAGGCYVPLDPDYPPERLHYILDDAAPEVVLYDTQSNAVLTAYLKTGKKSLDISQLTLSDLSKENPNIPALTSRHLAYVIYTSGSTGNPKGVMIEHRSLVNLLLAMSNKLNFTHKERILFSSTISFDLVALEIYLPLINGSAVFIAHKKIFLNKEALVKMLLGNQITMIQGTPSTYSLITNEDTQFLNNIKILCGGEALPISLANVLSVNSHSVWNLYGPTETTIWSTAHILEDEELAVANYPSIGKPIANTRIYLLDNQHQPVPLGAVGELYIGGMGVARGYLNREELTAERFFPDPFHSEGENRMYRTGDLVRYRDDGNLEYIGRNDYQIKIRGFRIELGEIEARLLAHPSVLASAVVAIESKKGDKQLVAYLELSPELNQQSVAAVLRQHLLSSLPDYMVPVAFVALKQLPLTFNGKLDRAALPVPDESAYYRQDYEAPQGVKESLLAEIWGQLLSIERISRHDNFFSLGGHSLLTVKLISQLRKAGYTVQAGSLFLTPVLAEQAELLRDSDNTITIPPNRIGTKCHKIIPEMLPLIEMSQTDIDRLVVQVPGGVTNIQDIYGLSPLQDGILFHHLLSGEGDIYQMIFRLAFDNRSCLDNYIKALQQVIERHDILRSAFFRNGLDCGTVQVVLREAPLHIEDVTLCAESSMSYSEQLAARHTLSHHQLDLSEAPLLRLFIAQEPDSERWLVLEVMHHLIGDNTTLALIHHEIETRLAGHNADSLPVAEPYRNLIATASMANQDQRYEDYFRRMLANIDEPTAPFNLYDAVQSNTQFDECYRELPDELNASLRNLARHYGVSLASLVHLAWGVLLAKSSGLQKVVTGTVLFGRMGGEFGAEQGIGLFINTLPLRLDIDKSSVADALVNTHKRLSELLCYEHTPLVEAQRCSSVAAPAPLFTALLNYRHSQTRVEEKTAAFRSLGIEFLGEEERSNYPLSLSIEDDDLSLSLSAQVVTPLSAIQICDYVQQTLIQLVQALEQQPTRPVCQLDILPTDERIRLLNTWHNSRIDYPLACCIHTLFEQQAEANPQATALIFKGEVLSYAELNRWANKLAHCLVAKGVKPDMRVAICADRGFELIIGLLAILKAGGAYVPLDPVYPPERLRYILEDAQPTLLLHDAVGKEVLKAVSIEDSACLMLELALFADRSEAFPVMTALTAKNLAYVIYTSGSTGRPKGVMIEHQAIYQRACFFKDQFAISAEDRVLQFSSISFDASVEEIFSSLSHGATLVLRDESWVTSAQTFLDCCDVNKITTMLLPAVFWSEIADKMQQCSLPDSIRLMIIGGEAAKKSAFDLWFNAKGHRPMLINAYGPTEATIIATTQQVTSAEYGNYIGRPVTNARIYLLDDQQLLVPSGAIGEVYIGGEGVARGYLNRPELTAERFFPDPFHPEPHARMYRSGDLARYNDKGNLEYLGRNDHQIKIRGYRIEPGEIEACLDNHPRVLSSAIIAREDRTTGKRLVAYIVISADVAKEPLVATLRQYLLAMLPEYMVPAAFVVLERLPLTPNGKIDRKALPAPDISAYEHQSYQAPHGEIEQMVADIWCELLGIEKVSRFDNFFSLGGHSLLVIQLMGLLRKRGYVVPAGSLFSTSKLADQAAILKEADEGSLIPANLIGADGERIVPEMLPLVSMNQTDIDKLIGKVPGGVSNIQDIYALAPLQDGILFHHLLAQEGDPYQVIFRLAFNDRQSLDAYIDALQQVVNRHDILRTVFLAEDLSCGPVQVVLKSALLQVTEVSLAAGSSIPFIEQLAAHHTLAHHRLALNEAPLLRLFIAQEPGSERWLVQEVMHHLIGDHATLDVMHNEISLLLSGQAEQLSIPVPYRNLVACARRANENRAYEAYFRALLADIDEPTAPFAIYDVEQDGGQVDEYHLELPHELNVALRGLARHFGVSLASLMHLGWGLVLAKSSDRQQVVTGTVLFGRMGSHTGAEQGMGLFINTLPLRMDIDTQNVADALIQTHERLSQLLAYEHTPLAEAQRCSGVVAPTPLFTTLINYRHNRQMDSGKSGFCSLRNVERLGEEERSNYPLNLSVEDNGNSLGLTVQVVAPLSAVRLCGYIQQALEQIVWSLNEHSELPVCQLNILPQNEVQLLLEEWNRTQASYPAELCIHRLFEQRAETNPDAPAIVFDGEVLSYMEVNHRANQLAHALIAQGVIPDARIAVCAEISPEMVVGLLAILKAGGAYVPIDPRYPHERLRYIVENAEPVLVLYDKSGEEALKTEYDLVKKGFDLFRPIDCSGLNHNPEIAGLNSSHLAYVIYTSGSTGQPKGIMVEHRNIVNLINCMMNSIMLPLGFVTTPTVSISFDVSVRELLFALCSGAQLLLPPLEESSNPIFSMDWRASQPIDLMYLVAPLASESVKRGKLPASLKYLMTGGDKCTLAHADLPAGCTLIDNYGPAETTVDSTFGVFSADDIKHHIGRPIANTSIYLLDRYQNPVPLGAVGEIYIGGAGVARGYIKQPELTAERFLHDPFCTQPGSRMYRSGDLARYDHDGNIEYIGRNDRQIKIQGVRIEPGEIELLIEQYNDIEQVVVIARNDVGETPCLVAYLVLSSEANNKNLLETLRHYLRDHLPPHMIPAAYVILDSLPLSPNGKVDRKALPVPDQTAYAASHYEPPQNELEEMLISLWQELLAVNKIGRNDNFFQLGGQSLLVVRFVFRLQEETGFLLPFSSVFKTPVLCDLSDSIILSLINKN